MNYIFRAKLKLSAAGVGAEHNATQVNRSGEAVLSARKKVRELDFYNKSFC